MKVFVDECIDWRFARSITGHETRTARQMGWSSIKNGELLALAAEQFEVFLTVDRNLSFQQNLPAVAIAVIVLRASPIGSPICSRSFQNCSSRFPSPRSAP